MELVRLTYGIKILMKYTSVFSKSTMGAELHTLKLSDENMYLQCTDTFQIDIPNNIFGLLNRWYLIGIVTTEYFICFFKVIFL